MRALKFLIFYIVFSITLYGQNADIETRIGNGGLKMSFPSIYFKHNSTAYTTMPYTVDSCFKYISSHFEENINSLVIWRDSAETEDLTIKRIKKLNSALKKYLQTKEFEIYSMGNAQKISRQTINMAADSSKIQYLLPLNSVFDFSKTHIPKDKSSKAINHVLHPKIWCWKCWKSGFHLDKRSREMRKMERRRKEKAKDVQKS